MSNQVGHDLFVSVGTAVFVFGMQIMLAAVVAFNGRPMRYYWKRFKKELWMLQWMWVLYVFAMPFGLIGLAISHSR